MSQRFETFIKACQLADKEFDRAYHQAINDCGKAQELARRRRDRKLEEASDVFNGPIKEEGKPYFVEKP